MRNVDRSSQLCGALLVIMVSALAPWLFCMNSLMGQTGWIMVEGAISSFKYGGLVKMLYFPQVEVSMSSLCSVVFLSKESFLWANT